MIRLLQAVVTRVDELFPKSNIYVKDVEQGLVEPCFFIRIVKTSSKLEFQRRYRVDSLVNIVYLNQNADAFLKEEIEQKLLYGMRNVVLNTGGIYGFSPNSKTGDSEVNFTINYKYTTKEEIIADPYMMDIENIIHYTEEAPYKKATAKPNPGMWETKPWPDEHKVYPSVSLLDSRYKKDEKMWDLQSDEKDLMRKRR